MPTLLHTGHAAYAASASATASPAEVVRMAYGRVVTACDRMSRAVEQRAPGWIELFNNESLRAQALLFELTGMLANDSADPDVASLADNLRSLYAFCERKLVAANVTKDPRPVAEVRDIVEGLRSAWEIATCR